MPGCEISDWKLGNAILKFQFYQFSQRQHSMNIESVAVFCGSHSGKNPLFTDHVKELGKLLAMLKVKLVYGGGHKGLMGTLADSVLAHCDAVIVLPGGFGTMDELFEILTWNQLKIHHKKIYILNSDGFYNHLQKHINQMKKEGFLQDELLESIFFCHTPIELFNKIN
jgi:hypothetical protein